VLVALVPDIYLGDEESLALRELVRGRDGDAREADQKRLLVAGEVPPSAYALLAGEWYGRPSLPWLGRAAECTPSCEKLVALILKDHIPAPKERC
jgi:hypothetical protein